MDGSASIQDAPGARGRGRGEEERRWMWERRRLIARCGSFSHLFTTAVGRVEIAIVGVSV